jgi:glutamyl-tRNA reductase
LYNVYLYDMDHLSEVVEQNKKARQDEVPRAEAIVEEQVAKFQKWQSGVEASAVVSALRARLLREREAFLRERLAAWPDLSAEDRNRMAALMDELLNRVLLEPAESLKGEHDLRRKLQNLEALRDLFHLERDES